MTQKQHLPNLMYSFLKIVIVISQLRVMLSINMLDSSVVIFMKLLNTIVLICVISNFNNL